MILISEGLLQFIWKNLLFNRCNLVSAQGEIFSIISVGEINENAGPDFLNAHVVVKNVDLFGNIEVHVNSSDWDLHKHIKNKLYDNVILHVVWNHDKKIYNKNGLEISTFVIKDYIDSNIIRYIDLIIEHSSDIFCQKFFLLDIDYKRLIRYRLMRKIEYLNELFSVNKNDFNSTVFQFLMYCFGFKTNNANMLQLAQSIPFHIVQKLCHEYDCLLALFFGQAGLFEKSSLNNIKHLQRIYNFLKTKYNLQVRPIGWIFSRVRPSNFPTKRLLQLADFFYNNEFLCDWVINNDIDMFREKLLMLKPHLSKVSVDNFVINVFSPLTAFYKKTHKEHFIECFNKNLCFLPPENNKIVRGFFSLSPTNALETQSLLELFNNYCTKSRCLYCPVKLIKR